MAGSFEQKVLRRLTARWIERDEVARQVLANRCFQTLQKKRQEIIDTIPDRDRLVTAALERISVAEAKVKQAMHGLRLAVTALGRVKAQKVRHLRKQNQVEGDMVQQALQIEETFAQKRLREMRRNAGLAHIKETKLTVSLFSSRAQRKRFPKQ